MYYLYSSTKNFVKKERDHHEKNKYQTDKQHRKKGNYHDWNLIPSASNQGTCMDIYADTYFHEEKIVAITCDGTVHFSSIKLPGKTLYIPFQNEQNYADLIKGNLYGFDFDLTESEILLYNTNKLDNLSHRLETSFLKL